MVLIILSIVMYLLAGFVTAVLVVRQDRFMADNAHLIILLWPIAWLVAAFVLLQDAVEAVANRLRHD